MDVVVVGGHGKVALRLLRLLAGAGHRARGVIRDPGQAADLERAGAEPVVADVESEVSLPVAGADAVVFAAGAGPGSGAARKRTVDLGGALKLIDAARGAGVPRYVIVSAQGVRDPSSRGPAMRPYYEAKAEADAALERSGLEYTIVRPGRLTDEPGVGRIEIAEALERRGSVSRDDVAATLVAVLESASTIGKRFDLLQGETPIAEAVRAL